MPHQSIYHLLLLIAINLNEAAHSFTFAPQQRIIGIAIKWNEAAHSFTFAPQQRITGDAYKTSTTFSPSYASSKQHLREKEGDGEETYTFENNPSDMNNTPPPTSLSIANELDDLTPPPINLARGSILFSENPSTKRNNAVLDLWRFCKVNLPAVITGGWPWKDSDFADDNPIGGLYNIAFVRMPVIAVGFVYGKNLFDGHPLIVDLGMDGPFEMSPLVVIAVLGLILA